MINRNGCGNDLGQFKFLAHKKSYSIILKKTVKKQRNL